MLLVTAAGCCNTKRVGFFSHLLGCDLMGMKNWLFIDPTPQADALSLR